MPCDHRRVIERVDELEALGVADPLHLGERLADMGAVQDDPGPIPKTGLDLRPNGPFRHDDRDGHAGGAPGPGIGLSGVPGRQGDRAPRFHVVRQCREPVRHPARLERTRLLEMLRLEIEPVVADSGAGRDLRPARRRLAAHQLGAMDTTDQPFPGGLDLVDRDDVIAAAGHAAEYATRVAAIRPSGLACLRKR